MMKTKGFLALLISAILFASYGIMVRFLSQSFSPFQQIGFRNSIALVISLAIIFASKQSIMTIKNVKPIWLGLYSLAFPLAVVFYTLSILQTKIITTVFALYLGSLVMSLVYGLIFFREKLSLIKILSLGLVLIGLMVYAAPNLTGFFSVGTGLAVLSGFFDASANSLRKFLSHKVDRLALVVVQMVSGLVIALGLMTWFGQLTIPQISPTAWVIGLIFGASLVAISYLTLIGFANFDLNLGTVVLASELFFASIFAFLIFQEKSSIYELLGGSLIILATFCAQLDGQKISQKVNSWRCRWLNQS